MKLNRDRATTALELAGLGALVAGVWLVYLPAGLIVLGACLVLLGWLEGRK